MSSTAPSDPSPTRLRAVVCLLLNVIVFPGVGTLSSGERKRRKTGWLQLILGIVLFPAIMVLGMGTAVLNGVNPETVKSCLYALMTALVIWNVWTGLQIFWEAWKNTKADAKTTRNPSPPSNP